MVNSKQTLGVDWSCICVCVYVYPCMCVMHACSWVCVCVCVFFCFCVYLCKGSVGGWVVNGRNTNQRWSIHTALGSTLDRTHQRLHGPHYITSTVTWHGPVAVGKIKRNKQGLWEKGVLRRSPALFTVSFNTFFLFFSFVISVLSWQSPSITLWVVLVV